MVDLFLLVLAIVAVFNLIDDLRNKRNVPESLTILAMTIAALIVHYQFFREII